MKSLEELRELRAAAQSRLGIRNDDAATAHIVVGMGDAGLGNGARDVLHAFMREVESAGLQNIAITLSAPLGDRSDAPAARVSVGDGEPVIYVHLTPEKAAQIVREHVAGGHAVSEYTATR